MSAPDLKPCPFCGGQPYTRTRQDEDLSTHNTVDWHFVGCHNCDVSFGIPDGYDCGTASEQWNTRADLAPAAPKVKALVWHDNPDIGEGGFIAKGVFGCAYHAMEDGWSYYRQGLWADTKSLEAAKAAAQADYEARILAALEGGDR